MSNAWANIAARDGAIQIYHLGAVMRSIRRALRASPTLLSLTDLTKMRTAVRLLNSYFPNYELIRDAVAHSFYEVAPDAAGHRRHTVHHAKGYGEGVSEGAGFAISDSLVNRNYVVTFRPRGADTAKIASYEITAASIQKLVSVREHFWSAFEPAREAYRRSKPKAPPSAAAR
jgi:hypothetical protein